jgi:hypothetical protein
MKYQFNFFGILLFISIFVLLSSMGIFVQDNGSDETDTQMSNQMTFDNHTQNGTGDNQTQPDDDDDDDNQTCETGWQPPLANKTDFKAGSTIPVKFSYCANGTFVADENVTVVVNDLNGTEVASFELAKNPHLGIKIQGSTKYHVNWKTPKDAVGNFTIIASFSDGFELTKDISLF